MSIDPFRPARHSGSKPIHNLDARLKFIIALGFILTTSLAPQGAWAVYILLFSLAFSIALLSDVGIRHIYARAALALPFILAAFPLLFTVTGVPIFSFSIGSLSLTASWQGLERFISISFKSWISVQIAVLLATTTRLPDLLFAMRNLAIPQLIVAIIGLMWRYIFLMVEEANRLLRARLSRSGVTTQNSKKYGGSLTWRAKVAGNMAGNLLIRSLERSDRVYSAMLARGYDGEIRRFKNPPLTLQDWLILIGSIAVLVILLTLGLLLNS